MPHSIYLAAVDLTDESEEVLAAARRLADGMDAKLSCATVIQPLTGLLGDYEFVPAQKGWLEFEAEALEAARNKLTTLAGQFGIADTNVHACIGKPATEIRRLASELPAAMIIIGSHRRRGLDRLLGSTARALLCDAFCDVAVIRIHPFTDTQD